MTHRKIAVGAALAFGVSFLLPALNSETGYSCFVECWHVFTRSDSGHVLTLGGWLYYSGFVAANAVFIILVGAVVYPTPCPRVRMAISLVALLQVFSWLVVSIVHVDKQDPFALKAGYFLWLVSFVLLFAAHLNRFGNRIPQTLPAR